MQVVGTITLLLKEAETTFFLSYVCPPINLYMPNYKLFDICGFYSAVLSSSILCRLTSLVTPAEPASHLGILFVNLKYYFYEFTYLSRAVSSGQSLPKDIVWLWEILTSKSHTFSDSSPATDVHLIYIF